MSLTEEARDMREFTCQPMPRLPSAERRPRIYREPRCRAEEAEDDVSWEKSRDCSNQKDCDDGPDKIGRKIGVFYNITPPRVQVTDLGALVLAIFCSP